MEIVALLKDERAEMKADAESRNAQIEAKMESQRAEMQAQIDKQRAELTQEVVSAEQLARKTPFSFNCSW